MNKNTIFAVLLLTLLLMIVSGCTEKNADAQSITENNIGSEAEEAIIPTEQPTAVENDLEQESVENEITDLEKDLENW